MILTNMSLNTAIKTNLVRELNLENLSPEKQEEIFEKIGKIIFQKIILKITEILPEENLNDFQKLLENEAEENKNLFLFLQEKIPNFEEIVDETVTEFKEETTALFETARRQSEL